MSETLDRPLIKLSFILLTGGVAALLESTMVSVALADLSSEFGAPVGELQLVSTAYLLAMAVVIPLVGWLVDGRGAKTAWMVANGLFLVGSMLCGAAWSAGSLIAFRIVQGMGSGLILPLMQAILAEAAGPRRFGRCPSFRNVTNACGFIFDQGPTGKRCPAWRMVPPSKEATAD